MNIDLLEVFMEESLLDEVDFFEQNKVLTLAQFLSQDRDSLESLGLQGMVLEKCMQVLRKHGKGEGASFKMGGSRKQGDRKFSLSGRSFSLSIRKSGRDGLDKKDLDEEDANNNNNHSSSNITNSSDGTGKKKGSPRALSRGDVSPRSKRTGSGFISPRLRGSKRNTSPRGDARDSGKHSPRKGKGSPRKLSEAIANSLNLSSSSDESWWKPVWYSEKVATPNLDQQALEYNKEQQREDESPTYRNAMLPDLAELPSNFGRGADTLWSNFARTCQAVPDNKFLGTRKIARYDEHTGEPEFGKYVFETYAEVMAKVKNFAKGLYRLGLRKGEGLGLFCPNKAEYVIAELSTYCLGLFNASIYDTFGLENAKYVAHHSDVSVLFCCHATFENALQIAGSVERIRMLICAEKVTPSMLLETEELQGDVRLYSVADVIMKGETSSQKTAFSYPEPQSLACILYTSGTTGFPKGVVLSHSNLMANVCSTGYVVPLTSADSVISYLPMSHIMERVVFHVTVMIGGSVGFFSSLPNLVDDIQALRPSIVPGVPRIYDKMYAKITASIASKGKISKTLFNKAFVASAAALRKGKKPPLLWEKLVFSKIKKILGGRMKLLFCGGAPLNKKTQEYLSIVFATPLITGYGLTEAAGVVSASYFSDKQCGHIGPPIMCCEVKLVDCPEFEFFHTQTPPHGEICVRGPSVSLLYHKMKNRSVDKVFFMDGWLHTGDLGRIQKNGTLQIVDRLKNLFKLSNGEFVASEELEIWIPANTEKSYIVAVVALSPSFLDAWSESRGDVLHSVQWARSPELKSALMEELDLLHEEADLADFEKIRGIVLEEEEWSTDNGLTSPTLKLRRRDLRKKYQSKLKALYKEIEQ